MDMQSRPDPFSTVLDALRTRGLTVRNTGPARARAQCPAHGGVGLSLSVGRGAGGGVLLHCHSHGCTATDIASALGLAPADLFPISAGRGAGGGPTPAWYGVIPCLDGAIGTLEQALAGDPAARSQVRGEMLAARRAAIAALRSERAPERRAAFRVAPSRCSTGVRRALMQPVVQRPAVPRSRRC